MSCWISYRARCSGLAPLVLLAFWCGGCFLPLPEKEHQRDDMFGRTNITPQVIESLKAGQTRQEVLQRLGAPDGVFNEDRTFVYLWSTCMGYYFVYAGTNPDSGWHIVPNGHALIIQFDDAGVLQRHENLSKNNWSDLKEVRLGRTSFPREIQNPPGPATLPTGE